MTDPMDYFSFKCKHQFEFCKEFAWESLFPQPRHPTTFSKHKISDHIEIIS